MEKVDWTVDGMTCSNCALTVSKYLEKEGLKEVKVNPLNGSVSFVSGDGLDAGKLKNGIQALGYSVKDERSAAPAKSTFLSTNLSRFLTTLPFTLVLMLHMFHGYLQWHWLMNPWVQLSLCLPVFLLGMNYFGRSAIQSLRNGMPNMNVLVALGSLSAFTYSLTGTLLQLGEGYLFYESAASIITLVFLGNYLEDASIQSTQKALNSLAKSQKVMANMIAYDDQHQEQVFPIESNQLRSGDLVLIRTGEQVPADCKILWGDCLVNEAIITGESIPIAKQKKDTLIGGSVLDGGTVKAQVTAAGNQTILSGILKMVQEAQAEKPPIQKLADRISAVFVPTVIGIAVLTYIVNYFFTHASLGESLMRSIAVLVISCPCAMGLATPAALAVGLGRAAKKGIIFRNAGGLETFKTIRQVVFDKTGTITTGAFTIANYQCSIDENEFRQIAYSLESYSNHPIAQSISKEWKQPIPIRWKAIDEIKGLGVVATDVAGHEYKAGSYRILPETHPDKEHNVFITRNGEPIGWIDVVDSIRPEAADVMRWLTSKGIKTILLSGDKTEKCRQVAEKLGMDEFLAEQTPQQKMDKIAALNQQMPTAMVGDGINDAPALAKATLGISLSEASQIAVQQADVILMSNGLKYLPEALGIGEHTFITIRQNLFWAFCYNVVAIPIAAFGFLTPTFSALTMGLSDVVLAVNSVRLFVKKVL